MEEDRKSHQERERVKAAIAETLALAPFEVHGLLSCADWQALNDGELSLDDLRHLAFLRQRERYMTMAIIPEGWNVKSVCRSCGPVWLFAGAAPVVGGCPWCHVVAKGCAVPRPA